jgi:acetyl-CoA/propionyl-CoA carboxylase biotin carboxyl carrier protein
MFETVLIANRGEIAVRVLRTLRRLGVRGVAVHTDADAGARHVREADLAVRVPGYLDAGAIVAAALVTGAQAVHPGYGFLAENAAFARRCAEAGLVFVGPPPEAVEAMGDKIRAKATVSAAGVPVVPGGAEPADDLAEAAHRVGFPVLIKPSAGGGGKGMVLVREAAELPAAIESARRTAQAAFGDATLLVERFVAAPRHIEFQILADAHGAVVHLGERECSLQRRHQKIVEEAPSPLLDEETRTRMGAAAVEAARSVGYTGAGTVEFIVDGTTGAYHFMEMNTRLQVEHPVTELVTGLDLVEQQLRVAAGEHLAVTPQSVRLAGHAVEARLYAEDPRRSFLPTAGTLLAVRTPREHGANLGGADPGGPVVRIDSGLMPGGVVGTEYDPMLAKVIAWAPDREGALRALDQALAETVILGVGTNIPFLRALLRHPAVRAGDLDTALVERHLGELTGGGEIPADVLAAAALALHADAAIPVQHANAATPARYANAATPASRADAAALGPHADPAGRAGTPGTAGPWDVRDGWRLGEHAWTTWRLESRGEVAEVAVRGLPETGAQIRLPGVPDASVTSSESGGSVTSSGSGASGGSSASGVSGAAGLAGVESVEVGGRLRVDGADLLVTLDGVTRRYAAARAGETLWLGRDGETWAVTRHLLGDPGDRAGAGAAGDGVVRSPMPGTILVVKAGQGDLVAEGQPLLIVEAMKMEHTVTAPVGGVLAELAVRAGQSVDMDAILAVVRPEKGPEGGEA